LEFVSLNLSLGRGRDKGGRAMGGRRERDVSRDDVMSFETSWHSRFLRKR
jgi:hypothetical protein